jgi:hypothetical protein
MHQLTATQQDALDKITALLTLQSETGTITKRARNNVMQALDPDDLAAIAPAIVRFTRALHGYRDEGNNSGGAR